MGSLFLGPLEMRLFQFLFLFLKIAICRYSYDVEIHHQVQRRFFNRIFKKSRSFFRLKPRQQEQFSRNNDKWMCADGRQIPIKNILQGKTKMTEAEFITA